ncbi:hypothetical protein AMS60_07260 [Bacillus sp. FJAT-21945]|nr:hypothetical protein AMS60_07260 [Bacillus sp. FJAT-21945]
MKYSIIIRCYNTLPLIKKCIEAVLQSTDDKTEIILINNHPPQKSAIEYLQNLNLPRIIVLNPGKNIGNLEGFHLGARHANGENLVILDDDIIVPNNNWIQIMSQSLSDFPNLAYTALLCSHIHLYLLSNKDPHDTVIHKPEYVFQLTNNVVIFGCVMLKKSFWEKYFSDIKLTHIALYDIDRLYKLKADEIGMKTGYIISHMADHLGRTQESDLVYCAWKILYVFGLTTEEYVDWRKNKTKFTIEEEELLINNEYSDLNIAELKTLIANSSFQ